MKQVTMYAALAFAAAFAAAGATARAQSGMVNADDAMINYEVSGRDGREPVVVFIHGWAQDLTIWDEQVAALSPAYRVVRFDRRGHGKSTGHADPSADPDDLRILLDSPKISSAYVLGLSAGAGPHILFDPVDCAETSRRSAAADCESTGLGSAQFRHRERVCLPARADAPLR